jgi:hypothetical protein
MLKRFFYVFFLLSFCSLNGNAATPMAEEYFAKLSKVIEIVDCHLATRQILEWVER